MGEGLTYHTEKQAEAFKKEAYEEAWRKMVWKMIINGFTDEQIQAITDYHENKLKDVS